MVSISNLLQTNNQGAIIWVALALIVLIGGFSFSYLLRKRQPQPVLLESNLEQRRHKLLVELVQLDDDFESGKIQEEVYRRLRAEKKAQLVTLMQRPKENRGNS